MTAVHGDAGTRYPAGTVAPRANRPSALWPGTGRSPRSRHPFRLMF